MLHLKVFGAHPVKEFERGLHLLHAIHAVFNADPALVADIAQDLEDRVVVVESRAGDAVLQPLKIADRAVTAGKIFESVSLGKEAVAGGAC